MPETQNTAETKTLPNNNNVITTVEPITKMDVKKLQRGSRLEEIFLKFCFEKLELPEREGKLPQQYSHLSNEEVRDIINNPNTVKLTEEVSSATTDKDLEKMRVKEAVVAINENIGNSAVVHSKEDLTNPLGTTGNSTLLFVADYHHAPSDVETGIRTEAFTRYKFQRIASRMIESITQKKRFGSIGKSVMFSKEGKERPPENTVRRFIEREDVRYLFNRWIEKLVSTDSHRETTTDTEDHQTILVPMGDNVHDGAFLIDQLAINEDFRTVTNNISQPKTKHHPKLLELYGNHDQDSRIPESFSVLTSLYGHRIYTQEISGVLVAVLDTNIENPKWIEIFTQRATKEELEVLKDRQDLQEEVLKRITEFEGPVLLMGHNPSRLIDAFAVKRPIIQNSNITAIVGGHTHQENHLELPFKNKKGETIVMHVVESTARLKGSVPQAPKIYGLDIEDGKISQMRTMVEPQDSFEKKYDAHIHAL